jgi:hypothetical protein
LNNFELESYAKQLRIPYFRGVYMRDALPKNGPRKNESAIVNLDSYRGKGTHWVSYMKIGAKVQYYDSFGVPPPTELQRYLLQDGTILFNYEQDQNTNEVICGHLCLKFLTRYVVN